MLNRFQQQMFSPEVVLNIFMAALGLGLLLLLCQDIQTRLDFLAHPSHPAVVVQDDEEKVDMLMEVTVTAPRLPHHQAVVTKTR